jgi:hypothetical protein
MSDYRPLTLAKGMHIHLSRIGYPDEGIRLTVHQGLPFNFDSTVQLSRSDAEWLVTELNKMLKDPDHKNLPA